MFLEQFCFGILQGVRRNPNHLCDWFFVLLWVLIKSIKGTKWCVVTALVNVWKKHTFIAHATSYNSYLILQGQWFWYLSNSWIALNSIVFKWSMKEFNTVLLFQLHFSKYFFSFLDKIWRNITTSSQLCTCWVKLNIVIGQGTGGCISSSPVQAQIINLWGPQEEHLRKT